MTESSKPPRHIADVRAPREAGKSFARESALDELAYAANIDPLDLRLRNDAEARDCYKIGAAAFIWNARTPAPGSMREGRLLVGLGMAGATNPDAVHVFGAQFAEVQVDPDLGTIRVVRQLGAFMWGRNINAKLAHRRYIDGMAFGLGMALFEETRRDERSGREMNENLAEYLLPLHADVPATEAILVAEVDPHVNGNGVNGIGEIGIVGAAAAIANAVYHATGKRIRDLPITPDKLLV